MYETKVRLFPNQVNNLSRGVRSRSFTVYADDSFLSDGNRLYLGVRLLYYPGTYVSSDEETDSGGNTNSAIGLRDAAVCMRSVRRRLNLGAILRNLVIRTSRIGRQISRVYAPTNVIRCRMPCALLILSTDHTLIGRQVGADTLGRQHILQVRYDRLSFGPC